MINRSFAIRASISGAVYALLLIAGVLVHPRTVSALDKTTVTIEFSDPMLHARALKQRWRDFITPDYNVRDETFRLFVPDSYDSDTPHGILVWVSPADHGKIPSQYHDLFKQHRLLAISAKNGGNERNIYERIMMALDGAHYLKRTYTVDEQRIYVSGLSGGGRTASVTAFLYPDLFNGGAYMNGCNYYRNIATGDKGFWSGFLPNAPQSLLQRVKRNRHAFITASNDPNKKQTKKYYEAAKGEGWQHVTYIEQPDHGHDPVGKKWFKKAIKALDDPLRKQAASYWASFGQGSSSEKTVLQKWRMLQSIWLHGGEDSYVQKARKRMKQLQPRANKMATRKLNKAVNSNNNFSADTSIEEKLRTYDRQWKGLPVRKKVRKQLQQRARQKLTQLQQQQDVSPAKIRSFYNKWIGVGNIAKRTMNFYEHRASKASQSFDNDAPVREQLRELKKFQRRWAGSNMADEAMQHMNQLLQDIVQRIKKKPATPQTTKALIQLFIAFPRTDTADDIAMILDDRGKLKQLNRRMKQARQGR